MSLAVAGDFAASALLSLSLQAVKVAATKPAVIKPTNFFHFCLFSVKSRKKTTCRMTGIKKTP